MREYGPGRFIQRTPSNQPAFGLLVLRVLGRTFAPATERELKKSQMTAVASMSAESTVGHPCSQLLRA